MRSASAAVASMLIVLVIVATLWLLSFYCSLHHVSVCLHHYCMQEKQVWHKAWVARLASSVYTEIVEACFFQCVSSCQSTLRVCVCQRSTLRVRPALTWRVGLEAYGCLYSEVSVQPKEQIYTAIVCSRWHLALRFLPCEPLTQRLHADVQAQAAACRTSFRTRTKMRPTLPCCSTPTRRPALRALRSLCRRLLLRQ